MKSGESAARHWAAAAAALLLVGFVPGTLQGAQPQLQALTASEGKASSEDVPPDTPGSVKATLERAARNIQTGNAQSAIEELETLIKAEPGLASAYVLLGTAHLVQRDPKRAEATIRQLIARAPKDRRGPYLLGMSLLSQGRPAEARPQLEASLALAPGYVEPLAQLVRLDFREKKPEAALERVQRQLAQVPGSARLHQLLGNVHELRREGAEAETAYLQAIQLEPEGLALYIDLARLYATTGRFELGLARAEDALKVNPKSPQALMLVGMLSHQQGDVTKATEAYERVLAVNPRFTPAANNLAYLLIERGGDKDRALQLAQIAKEGAPDDPHIADTLGWILYQRGDYEQAVGPLHEAASKLSEHPVVRYHLGMAHLARGDKDAARRELEAALRLQATFPGADEARKALRQLP